MAETLNLNTEDNTNKPKINIGGIMQGVTGGAGALATAYSTYGNLAKEDNLTSRINSMYSPAFRGQEDFDSLESAYMNFSPYSHLTLQDVGFNKGQAAMNIASSSMQGAGAGAAFGGWGALIGGVAGLAGGLFGFGAAKRKATKLRNEANSQIDEVNAFNARNLNNRLYNAQAEQFNTLKLADLYALGGPLHSYGADWTNGLITIDTGGTHEQNPNEGVQMGIAPDGQPNLVEEGEVIWNDYVFSNRLKTPKKFADKYQLGGVMTFADAAKYLSKEIEERPNDPISRRGLVASLSKLMLEQETMRQKKGIESMFSNGGTIHIDKNKRGTFTAAASKHGKSVQEFASQVLANPDNYSPAMRKKANFARNAAKWHGNGGHLYPKGSFLVNYPFYDKEDRYLNGERPAFGSWYNDLPIVVGDGSQVYSDSPNSWNTHYIPGTNTVNSKTTPKKGNSSWLTGLRYAPVVGSALNVFSDLMGWTNKPDYSSADAILEASKGVRDVSFRPIGDYLAYNPFDRMFYLNQLNANAGATRRATLNTAAGNRGAAMAGILAADNNMMNSIGQLARQAEEYNLAQRQKVAEFNRATNMFNSEGFLKAQQANQGASEVRMRAAQAAAAMRDAIDQRVGTAKSLNLTNLFNNLGDIGWEEFNRNMINSSPYLDYLMNRTGNLDYKGKFKSKGGYITIKNKRRRK